MLMSIKNVKRGSLESKENYEDENSFGLDY